MDTEKLFCNRSVRLLSQGIALVAIVLLIIARASFSLGVQEGIHIQLLSIIGIDILIGSFTSILLAKPDQVLPISILALVAFFFTVAPFLYLVIYARFASVFIPLHQSFECAAALFGLSISQVIYVLIKRHSHKK